MTRKRKVEIFTAGCGLCKDTVARVKSLSCDACEVEVLDMDDAKILARAKNYSVTSVPAIVIDGQLAECCVHGALTEESLRAAGIGTPLA